MKMKKLDEKTMSKRESCIPEVAENAVKQARIKTLKAGHCVIEAVNGKLIQFCPDGSHKVLKTIPAPTPAAVGQKKVRRVK